MRVLILLFGSPILLFHSFKNSSHNWFCSVFLIKENDGNCLAIARDQNLGSLFILLDQAHMNE